MHFFFSLMCENWGGGLTSVPPQILSNISSSHNITQDKGRVILFSTLSATVEKMNEAIIRRKLYLKKNAKHIRQVAQAYRHRNREKSRVWERRYREKNRELVRTRKRIYQKCYKQRHKKKIQEYQWIYRAKNQNKNSTNLKKEKNRLKNNKKGKLTSSFWRRIMSMVRMSFWNGLAANRTLRSHNLSAVNFFLRGTLE